MKKVLFIDRDGTLINEAPPTYQLDDFSKLEFYPNMFYYLRKIVEELDYELVMVTNQDGLGTNSFPESTFWPIQNFVIQSLKNEGIVFQDILIDKSFPQENSPNRKPQLGMLGKYINNTEYDLFGSFVIGDRITDMQLAKNLGCKGFWLNNDDSLGKTEVDDTIESLRKSSIVLETRDWKDIYAILKHPDRKIETRRKTNETDIQIEINLDGNGKSSIQTGLPFFDHMLEQISKHGEIDLKLVCDGDLKVDEHHTIEDTAIVLGEAFHQALGNKKGINRYGFLLPMDDCLAQVSIDFGGRNWLVWDAEFKREKIGEMPTEMFYHFFKSFTDGAKCNLNIKAEGTNEHHKIESIFKAFARSIKMAKQRSLTNDALPSTKGSL